MGRSGRKVVRGLRLAERIARVEGERDRVAVDGAAASLTPAQAAELDRRLAAPDGRLYSWLEIKAGLVGKK